MSRMIAIALLVFAANANAGLDPRAMAASATTVTSHRGEEMRIADFEGRIVLLSFMFTSCPSICPTLTADLRRAFTTLPPEVQERLVVINVSVDPKRDSIAALSAYATKHRADFPTWHFVRSEGTGFEALRSYYEGEVQDGEVLHRNALYLLGTKGELMLRFRTTPLDTERLKRDIVSVHNVLSSANGATSEAG